MFESAVCSVSGSVNSFEYSIAIRHILLCYCFDNDTSVVISYVLEHNENTIKQKIVITNVPTKATVVELYSSGLS